MEFIESKYRNKIDKLITDISNREKLSKEWILLQIKYDFKNNLIKSWDNYIDNIIKKNKLGFNHHVFKNEINEETEQDEYVKNPFQAVEGIMECISCKSKKIYTTTRQTRSSDEQLTIINTCTECYKTF